MRLPVSISPENKLLCFTPYIGLSREERTQVERSLTQLNRFISLALWQCAILSNIEEENKVS